MPPAPPAGIPGWYSAPAPAPAPYPPAYHWPSPPPPPLHPFWNNYHIAAHATPQNAVPLPHMFGPLPNPVIIANPYAGPPIDYATLPVYQALHMYHGGFLPMPPLHPVPVTHPSPGQLSPFSQPIPASQFQGPAHPSSHHIVESGAERTFRPALFTASRPAQSSSGTSIGKHREGLKRTKQTPFVMWVGNIDSTVTVQELYEFFRQIDPAELQSPEESAVVSTFLIPRSNCAFVNFRTEATLTESITRFHGARLRLDSGAPRLACRRRTADHYDPGGEWEDMEDAKGVQEYVSFASTRPLLNDQ
jgi:hypothetical protein